MVQQPCRVWWYMVLYIKAAQKLTWPAGRSESHRLFLVQKKWQWVFQFFFSETTILGLEIFIFPWFHHILFIKCQIHVCWRGRMQHMKLPPSWRIHSTVTHWCQWTLSLSCRLFEGEISHQNFWGQCLYAALIFMILTLCSINQNAVTKI